MKVLGIEYGVMAQMERYGRWEEVLVEVTSDREHAELLVGSLDERFREGRLLGRAIIAGDWQEMG